MKKEYTPTSINNSVNHKLGYSISMNSIMHQFNPFTSSFFSNLKSGLTLALQTLGFVAGLLFSFVKGAVIARKGSKAEKVSFLSSAKMLFFYTGRSLAVLTIMVIALQPLMLSAQNPFTAMTDINILAEQNIASTAGDIEGAIAMGGNFVDDSPNGFVKMGNLKERSFTCATLTGLNFDNQAGGSDIAFTNGGTYTTAQLGSSYLLEAVLSGTVGSVVFNVTGAQTINNTENTAPYHMVGSGSTWTPVAGTYTVVVKVYAGADGTGTLCSTQTFTFTVTTATCNNVTNGGTIGSNQSIVSGSAPAPLSNVTTPSGGSGTIEYLWLSSTTIPCPAVGNASWTTIANTNSATYAPGTLGQTTCFLRCSRRAGCTNYDGESNAITITVTPGSINCTCPGNLLQNPSFENGTTNWSWSGGNLYTGAYAAQCGANSGQFEIINTSSNWFLQTISSGTTPVGSVLNLSVYAGTHDPTFYHQVSIDYFDSNWNFLSSSVKEVNAQLPAMAQYTITSTVPAGAYYINVGGTGNGSWIKTDNWCLTVTSPPNNTCALDPSTTGSLVAPNGSCYSPFTFVFDPSGTGIRFNAVSGTITRNNSNTVTLNMSLVRQSNSAQTANLSMTFSGYSTVGTAHSDCITPSGVFFYTSFTGALIGTGGLSGLSIALSRGSYDPAQFGYGGSTNSPASYFGMSSWMNATVSSGGGANGFPANGSSRQSDLETDITSCAPACNISGTISGATTVCSATCTTITASASGGTAPYTYSWSNGLGAGASKSVCPTSTTDYYVTITDATGCTTVATIKINVNGLPAAAITGNQSICTGGSSVFTASGGSTYN